MRRKARRATNFNKNKYTLHMEYLKKLVDKLIES